MKKSGVLTRFIAILLSFLIGFPAPAYAMRPVEPKQTSVAAQIATGLEEGELWGLSEREQAGLHYLLPNREFDPANPLSLLDTITLLNRLVHPEANPSGESLSPQDEMLTYRLLNRLTSSQPEAESAPKVLPTRTFQIKRRTAALLTVGALILGIALGHFTFIYLNQGKQPKTPPAPAKKNEPASKKSSGLEEGIPEPPEVLLASWANESFMPGLRHLAGSGWTDFSLLQNAAQIIPADRQEYEQTLSEFQKELPRLQAQAVRGYPDYWITAHAVEWWNSHWFARSNRNLALFMARALGSSRTAVDCINQYAVGRLQQRMEEKLVGRTVPLYVVEHIFPADAAGMGSHWAPTSRVIMIRAEGRQPWIESDMEEEKRHAEDHFRVEDAAGRPFFYSDEAFLTQFAETQLSSGAEGVLRNRMWAIANRPGSGMYDARFQIASGFKEFAGQLAGAMKNPALRIENWVLALQDVQAPLELQLSAAYGISFLAHLFKMKTDSEPVLVQMPGGRQKLVGWGTALTFTALRAPDRIREKLEVISRREFKHPVLRMSSGQQEGEKPRRQPLGFSFPVGAGFPVQAAVGTPVQAPAAPRVTGWNADVERVVEAVKEGQRGTILRLQSHDIGDSQEFLDFVDELIRRGVPASRIVVLTEVSSPSTQALIKSIERIGIRDQVLGIFQSGSAYRLVGTYFAQGGQVPINLRTLFSNTQMVDLFHHMHRQLYPAWENVLARLRQGTATSQSSVSVISKGLADRGVAQIWERSTPAEWFLGFFHPVYGNLMVDIYGRGDETRFVSGTQIHLDAMEWSTMERDATIAAHWNQIAEEMALWTDALSASDYPTIFQKAV